MMETLHYKLQHHGTLVLGVLLFDDHAQLDVYGPLELLTGANYSKKPNSFQLQLIGLVEEENGDDDSQQQRPKLVGPTPYTHVHVAIDTLLETSSSDTERCLDVLLIPGGPGVAAIAPSMQEKIRTLVERHTTVCVVFGDGLSLLQEPSSVLAQENDPSLPWKVLQTAASGTDTAPSLLYYAPGVSAGMECVYHAILGPLFGPKLQQQVSHMTEYAPLGDGAYHVDKDRWACRRKSTAQPCLYHHQQTKSIAFILYDSFEMMDTFGPMEMFLTANWLLDSGGITITTLAETRVVRSVQGPTFTVDRTFDEVLEASEQPHFDLLVLPGGIGCLREIHNPLMHAMLRRYCQSNTMILTICTGANILAATGILDGRRATGNKLAFRTLAAFRPNVEWVEAARWVVSHGNQQSTNTTTTRTTATIVTSSGVSAGTDAALAVLDLWYTYSDEESLADKVSQAVGYIRNQNADHDPFSHTIPRNSVIVRLGAWIQSTLLAVLYRGGMALGFPMFRLAPQLVGASS